MRLSPRKAEVDHVIEAIDQDHPTVTAAAKAAIKAVSEALDMRDWWTLVEKGSPVMLWGVYATEGEAKKAATSLRASGGLGELVVYPIASPALIFARIEGTPVTDDCECGHPQALHLFEASSRGKCGLSTCDCAKMKKVKYPIPNHPTCLTCRQPLLN